MEPRPSAQTKKTPSGPPISLTKWARWRLRAAPSSTKLLLTSQSSPFLKFLTTLFYNMNPYPASQSASQPVSQPASQAACPLVRTPSILRLSLFFSVGKSEAFCFLDIIPAGENESEGQVVVGDLKVTYKLY